MSEGFLYEPRSFWSTQTVTPSQLGVTRVLLPKRHFFNGEKWPIQIKRVAIMGLNYSFMGSNRDEVAVSVPVANQAASIINRVGIAVSVPQRWHINTKRFALTAALMPRPTWAPEPPQTVPGVNPSSLWGQSMLKFDKPLYLPRMGTIEWSVSATTQQGADTNPMVTSPQIYMRYQEEGGLFAGSARTFGTTQGLPVQLRGLDNSVFVPSNSEERWPYVNTDGTDGVYSEISSNWWPPETHFNAQIFNRQEATRAGSTKISGMNAMIDQIDFDAQVSSDNLAPQAPFSMRTGTKIRTVNGGTKTWWWRPGAPLALVFDHITPANVYDLPEMITLGPGEQLDVELEFPQVPATQNDMQVAVALNGYAAIEG